MKAVAYQQCLPIAHAESLLDVDLSEPAPGPHDLLVEVRAIAVNPVDTKMRAQAQPAPVAGRCTKGKRGPAKTNWLQLLRQLRTRWSSVLHWGSPEATKPVILRRRINPYVLEK